MKIFLDFETRSRIDLKQAGIYRYAADESTEILCVAVAIDGQEPTLHRSAPADLIAKASEIHAHNAAFERLILRDVCGLHLPIRRFRCTAVKAAYSNLPRDLAGACNAIGIEQQKDAEGRDLMLRLCKPVKKTGQFLEPTPQELKRLGLYCQQDVRAEMALDEELIDLPSWEWEAYWADQEINDRGFYVDAALLGSMQKVVDARFAELEGELRRLTLGDVRTGKQTDALLEWLEAAGLELDNLQAETARQTLATADLNPLARRVLEIRSALATSSVAKVKAMQRMRGADGRIRGAILFYGASQTGRAAGKGVQPQNFPRPAKGVDQGATIGALLAGEPVRGEPLEAVSSCLRGTICAAPGKQLLCADYSGIEARVLAWLAGDEKTLAEFRAGVDPYLSAADAIYGCGVDKVTKEQRQIGKTVVLACGYQGWVGAFQKMAANYGVKIDDEEAAEVVGAWREAHEEICALWHQTLAAAIFATERGREGKAGRLRFITDGRWLRMVLPSGRFLSYYDPEVVEIEKHGRVRRVVSFWGVDSKTHKWSQLLTYGGKLVENATQATARDLLYHAQTKLAKTVVLSVHDELVLEVVKGEVEDLVRVMTALPAWAEGLPVSAEGWKGLRYRK